MKIPTAILSNRKEVEVIFSISKDDETNRIRGGKLAINIGMHSYFVDTLMENYNKWLGGEMLCIDGGSDLCVLNMGEIIDFILRNRYKIETALRGFSFDDKPKEKLNEI